jgi:purine-nucleoside phosphorylase
VVAFEGRLHLYEGHALTAATAWVRLARAAGAHTFVLTNAAGGLSPGMRPGDIMLITDHISLPGLTGYPAVASAVPGDYPWPRFTGQDGLYHPGLSEAARRAARQLGAPLAEGVYAMVHGPAYETPAERRALHRLGADAVGMSTAPEALAAFAGGGRVLAFSVITNVAEAAEPPTHEEVTRVSLAASQRLAELLRALLPALA